MITLTDKNKGLLSFHQVDVDVFEVEVKDDNGNTSKCELTEKQLLNLAEYLTNYFQL